MRLIKLYSNKESFKEIKFNETGLSIILACKSNKDGTNSKKTYNGVGKSFAIQLIHFCLGCQIIQNFQKLKNWEFYLDFKIGDEEFTSKRSTRNQNRISLNNREISLKDFKKILGEKIFLLNSDIKKVSFRNLLKIFIRNKTEAYLNYVGTSSREVNNWDNILNLSYLLGLDIAKNLKKEKIKSEIDKVKIHEKNIRESSVFKKAFKTNNDNVAIEISALEQKIEETEAQIEKFKVADSYSSIKEDSDRKTEELNQIRNKIFIAQQTLDKINESLKFKMDIEDKKIINFYKVAKIEIPAMVKKTIAEALQFHKDLQQKRKKRLMREQETMQVKLSSLSEECKKLSEERDQLLKSLSEKGALEEFVSVNARNTQLKMKKNDLEKYKNISTEYKIKKDKLSKDLKSENISTEEYLNSERGQKITKNLSEKFKQIVNFLYDDKESGFIIENNDGENKVRFNFNPYIHGDSSTGINEVKIFSFDWMVLLFGNNHNMKTLIHDSILFSNMDPRQRVLAFKYALKQADTSDVQYITMLNQEEFDSILKELKNDNNMIDKINNLKILTLADELPKNKLLGLDIDLRY